MPRVMARYCCSLLVLVVVWMVVFGASDHAAINAGGVEQSYSAAVPGWLYIADSNGDNLSEGRILVVDPTAGRIAATLRTGHKPDFVLSPDGRRLYIASSLRLPEGTLRDELAVIDTFTGKTMQTVENPGRWLSTVSLYDSRMAVSASGDWLFQLKTRIDGETTTYFVDAFDTRTGRFAQVTYPLPVCASSLFLPQPAPSRLAILCSDTQDVRVLDFDDSSGQLVADPARLAARGGPALGRYAGTAIVSPNRPGSVAIITGDGWASLVDPSTRRFMRREKVDAAARDAAETTGGDWFARHWIRQQRPIMSPDGTQLFVGVSRDPAQGPRDDMFNAVATLGVRNLRKRDLFKLPMPAWSIALNADGTTLYAIDAKHATLVMLDSRTGAELKRIPRLGVTPLFLTVSP